MIDPTLIIKPVITEKATASESKGKYMLFVRKDASKIEVRKMFEKLYGVKVAKINVMRTNPKFRSSGRSTVMKKPELKKVIVSVKDKKTLDLTKPKLK